MYSVSLYVLPGDNLYGLDEEGNVHTKTVTYIKIESNVSHLIKYYEDDNYICNHNDLLHLNMVNGIVYFYSLHDAKKESRRIKDYIKHNRHKNCTQCEKELYIGDTVYIEEDKSEPFHKIFCSSECFVKHIKQWNFKSIGEFKSHVLTDDDFK